MLLTPPFRAVLSAGILIACFAFGAMSAVEANIDLVSLPPREVSQLTIYNQEDLTLAREERSLILSEGLNRIQFSWAGTLIDPTSLELEFIGAPADLYRITNVVYPANTQNLLIWEIESKKTGPATIRISYFTSGLSWKADYVLIADAAEKTLDMEGWVRVQNRSGEDYNNTEVRLLVGEINLVEQIAELARRGIISEEGMQVEKLHMFRERFDFADLAAPEAMPMAGGMLMTAPKEIIKEGVSEYFLYTIEGREDIMDRWEKRLPSFHIDTIPFDVSYEFDEGKYGPQAVLLYKFLNDQKHKMGKEPLPDGSYAVYRRGEKMPLSYVNGTDLKYVPIGEEIELNLGNDGLVTVEPRMMDFSRSNIQFQSEMIDGVGEVIGYDETQKWRIEIRNSRNRPVPMKITRHFSGDWSIESKAKYAQKSVNSVEFEQSVPALGALAIEYTITTRVGSRARR